MADEIINGQKISASEALEQKLRIGISMVPLGKNGGLKESLERTFQQVERAKQEWESAVDSLTELICVVDGRGHII
jgi:hypothetical protein